MAKPITGLRCSMSGEKECHLVPKISGSRVQNTRYFCTTCKRERDLEQVQKENAQILKAEAKKEPKTPEPDPETTEANPEDVFTV